jgi:hypothetical protein
MARSSSLSGQKGRRPHTLVDVLTFYKRKKGNQKGKKAEEKENND